MTIPVNYREYSFGEMGIGVRIGGMAGPHRNDGKNKENKESDPRGIEWCMEFLKKSVSKNNPTPVLISLHEDENYTNQARKVGVEYYQFPTEDLAMNGAGANEFLDPLNNKSIDEIYGVVEKFIKENKSVTISCGSGDGRTGTLLAAIKLRLLLQEQCRKNPKFLEKEPSRSNKNTIDVLPRFEDINCTPLVHEAVKFIKYEGDQGENGQKSVEYERELDILHEYEMHVRNQLKIKNKKHKEISRKEEKIVESKISLKGKESGAPKKNSTIKNSGIQFWQQTKKDKLKSKRKGEKKEPQQKSSFTKR